MAKNITLTDVEKRNAELDERNAELGRTLEEVSSDRERVRGELRDLRSDHAELRKKADDLQKHLTAALSYQADLQRNIGVLEGYKMRVERVDDLDRGLPPLQRIEGSRPDGAAGPNPHYRGPRDGFFQR